jgi:phenylacetyl-CoA:acceptor oxidoreductase subunit 2
MSHGPAPWQQQNWDWRAAGNFICGGAGAGLVVFAAASGAQGRALALPMLAGLALVGCGLACVWLELGRPWRAMHVFFNPGTSWMTREAITATLLFPAGLAAAAGIAECVWLAAALAIAFVYCQSRMLRAARGIPAWREPLLSPLIVCTGLAEGGGVFFLTDALHRAGTEPLLVLFGTLVLARVLVWLVYRRRIAAVADPRALAALAGPGRALQFLGTVLPLALVALPVVAVSSGDGVAIAAGAAGLAAWITGACLKYALVTRAGFNQGFSLAHLPVRGARPLRASR